jgi:hypothetical protein
MGRRRTTTIVGALVLLALVPLTLAACSSSSSDSAPPKHEDPLLRAKVFCSPRAQREIGTSLGAMPERVTDVEQSKTVSSCRYVFADGSLAISMKRFATVAAARDSFDAQARRRGRRPESPMLGEGFETNMTTDGSIVVRSGRDLFDVDAAALPPQFGNPPQDRSLIALAAAVTVIGHWKPG